MNDLSKQTPAVAWRDKGEIATRDQWRGYLSAQRLERGVISLERAIKGRYVSIAMPLLEYVETPDDFRHGDILIRRGDDIHLTLDEWLLMGRAVREALIRRQQWQALRKVASERDSLTDEQLRVAMRAIV